MKATRLLNQTWHQLRFLAVSPLAQLVPPEEGFALASLLARAGVFQPRAPGARNPDRLPQLRAYLNMPGRAPASRFCDGSFRVVHAGEVRATCVADVAFHHALALRDTGEPPGAARIFEALALRVGGVFMDVRRGHGGLHRPDAYGTAQAFGAERKVHGDPGILYRSVRRRGGECLALFDGHAVKSCALREVIALRWDGATLA